MALPKIVTSWDISLDGIGYMGIAESVQLPKIHEVYEEVWGSGMYAKQKVPVGIEPMEATIKFLEITPFVYNLFGLSADAAGIILKAGLRSDTKETVPLLAVLHGRVGSIETDAFEGGKIPRQTITIQVKRYALSIGKHPAIVVDVENNVLNLMGMSTLTEGIKKALGF